MNPSQLQRGSSPCPYCGKVSVKFIVLSFLGLILFVFVNLLSSTSKLSVIVDMSIKMKGNVVEALNNLVDLSSADSVNGTISLKAFPAHENERMKEEQSVHFQFTDARKGIIFKNSSEERKMATKTEERKGALVSASNTKLSVGTKFTTKDSGNTESKSQESTSLNETNETFEKENTTKINKYGNDVNTNVNIRQGTCDSCFQHSFNYVIQNERICKVNLPDERIDLLILIFTTHRNIKARSALRTTWLTHTKNNTANIRYAFLLGETRDFRYKETVFEENQLFHDIIKEDFIDSYTNLTYKTIMGFKWAATKCKHAHYVMKTDDDMFVNVPNLLKLLKEPTNEQLQSTIIGACSNKARPIRNKNSKWFASVNSYPDKFYPGFCSGTGYVTSMHVATEIYKISPSVPFFHLEDVYVSLCIKKLGFKLKGTSGFNAGRPKMDPCTYKGGKLITAHQLTPIMLQLIWHRRCMRLPL